MAKPPSKTPANHPSTTRKTGSANTTGVNTMLRVAFLGLVILVAFIIVFPTARHYLQQRQQIAVLSSQVAAAQQVVDNQSAQLKRWSDPAYVEAQARSRLMYVLPGETPYRVLDPQVAATSTPSPSASSSLSTTHVLGGSDATSPHTPWYDDMWNSTRLAGK